ncbi:MAG: hypothetical protein KF900_00155 [Bacteroidetes bacterium]|nr:hypothetical protein [Bacteroidota bacterium]
MKKINSSLLIVGVALLFVSCTKGRHSVRFANHLWYYGEVSNVMINNVSFGAIAPGEKSDYKSIPAGSFTVSAYLSKTNAVIKGTGYIRGKGKHQWTVSLNSFGDLSLEED